MSDMGEFIPHSQRDLKFLREGHRRGRHFEREAIVAWLRDEETWRRVARGNLADYIERGEHLGGDDE